MAQQRRISSRPCPLLEIMPDIAELALPCPGKPVDHILMELRMVGFESKDIVCFPFNDSARDIFLAVERINRHVMNNKVSNSGTAVISSDFSSTLRCPSRMPVSLAPALTR